MNERVQELKSQCWDERPYGPPWFNSDKFAELIVRECAQVADQWVDDEDNGHNLVSAKLKKHFGVEE